MRVFTRIMYEKERQVVEANDGYTKKRVDRCFVEELRERMVVNVRGAREEKRSADEGNVTWKSR